MKSKWLPTFPLHAANWLADPRVQMLSPVNKSILLESLLRSWMLGKAIEVVPGIAEVYAELWPEYEAVREEHHRNYEKRVKQTEAARVARHAPVTAPVTPPVTVSVTEDVPTSVTGPVTGGSPSPSPSPSQALTPTKTSTPQKLSPDKPGRETWVTPFAEAWSQRTGGEMVIERALRPLAKLRKRYGPERVLLAWLNYLDQTEVEYLSVHNFAAKFGKWDGSAEQAENREYRIAREIMAEGLGDDPFRRIQVLG